LENYFNYFTEIEEQYQRRRGTGLLLSTVDWALIETWKDAGIPLEAVLRGIDESFDKYDRRPSKTKKINSLAYCAQEVLAAAEAMKEAAVGGAEKTGPVPAGFSPEEVAQFLRTNAQKLQSAPVNAELQSISKECAGTLNELAEGLLMSSAQVRLEDVERRMTILEEKLLAALTITAPEELLVALRTEADREIAPYRSKMPAAQIEQLTKQFVNKRLLEQAKMPRLSLFYM
jgi:hypothetical protein